MEDVSLEACKIPDLFIPIFELKLLEKGGK